MNTRILTKEILNQYTPDEQEGIKALHEAMTKSSEYWKVEDTIKVFTKARAENLKKSPQTPLPE